MINASKTIFLCNNKNNNKTFSIGQNECANVSAVATTFHRHITSKDTFYKIILLFSETMVISLTFSPNLLMICQVGEIFLLAVSTLDVNKKM